MFNNSSKLLFLLLLFLNTSSLTASQINIQGMSGLVNIPDASVMDKGQAQIQLSNIFENKRSSYTSNHYERGVNENVLLGIFDNVELAWRNNGRKFSGGSDMSFNIKWQLPFFKEWFDIALGIQDLGGASNYYDAEYIVISKTIGFTKLSAGYSHSFSDSGPMNGSFYGMEILPLPWLAVNVEYDGADVNRSLNLSTPSSWMSDNKKLTFTVAQMDETVTAGDNLFYAISFSFPLGANRAKNDSSGINQIINSSINEFSFSTQSTHTLLLEDNQPEKSTIITKAWTDELYQRIKSYGFDNVNLGTNSQTLVLRFESTVFNANSLDALGVVLGAVSEYAPESFKKYSVTMQKNGINQVTLQGNISGYRHFIQTGVLNDMPEIITTPNEVNDETLWLKKDDGTLTPKLTLSPSLISTIGTEVGMLDYSLALNTQLEIPLSKGLSFYSSADILLSNSGDFENGIFKSQAKKSQLMDIYLSKTFSPATQSFDQLQLGIMRYNNDRYIFAQNEAQWSSLDGIHQLNATAGRYLGIDNSYNLPVLLGSYRYYWDEKDIRLKLSVGQFLGQDQGYKIEADYLFDDTVIKLNFRHTKLMNSNVNAVMVAGIGFSVPLTSRQEKTHLSHIQITGIPSWYYSVNSRVGDDHNGLAYNVADIPMIKNNINNQYLNIDRLFEAYISKHMNRLRDAYITYR